MDPFRLRVGVKSDPIEYRYTYPWLFRLMAQCGVHDLQLGTFFELYHLPRAFFDELRVHADEYAIRIRSVFTSHRELGGFYRQEPGWIEVARANYERLIEVAAWLGAESAGTNPGSVPRDRMEWKPEGIATYLRHMQELMEYAAQRGVRRLTLEPMSCSAEPPATPDEIRSMLESLRAYHEQYPQTTADVGLCLDISHGIVDQAGRLLHRPLEILDAVLPYVTEVHLKNTDCRYGSTFGFSPGDRARGVVDVAAAADLLRTRADELPVRDLVGYLEIGGPKLGRDYSDRLLEDELRESLQHCKEAFEGSTAEDGAVVSGPSGDPTRVLLSPSLMCADALELGQTVRQLEALGADLLHLDIMDARFTPNMPVGLELVKAVATIARVPLDVHLMVMDNDFFVERLAGLGACWVSVHVESATHLDRTLTRIRDLGMKAGAALNPATPLSAIEHVLERLDFVLIMTVNPGFAGQSLVPSTLRKIAECRRWLDGEGRRIPVQVDGNVSFQHIPAMVAGGADVLVCGSSSLFAPGSLAENFRRTREAVRDGLRRRGSLT